MHDARPAIGLEPRRRPLARGSHFTALAVLRDAAWDVNTKGLSGVPRVRVLASECRHGSIDGAVRVLGLGMDNLVAIEPDPEGAWRTRRSTTGRGRRAMRVSVVNWRTSEPDVRRAIAAVASALRSA